MPIPMTPDDFSDDTLRQPHLVNDDMTNFFNGVFTESFIYYRVAYRHSDDAVKASGPGIILEASAPAGSTFAAPTYETFQVIRRKKFNGIEFATDPSLFLDLNRYIDFQEELDQAVLTAEFRGTEARYEQDTDTNLTSMPFSWDFIVKRQSGVAVTWSDILIIEFEVDGTGLLRIIETTEASIGNIPISFDVPPPQSGAQITAQRGIRIPDDLGGQAFMEILFNDELRELNWDGSLYQGGVTTDEDRRTAETDMGGGGMMPDPPTETPPDPTPVCARGYVYNSGTGVCDRTNVLPPQAPAHVDPTYTCPDGWDYDSNTGTCVASGG